MATQVPIRIDVILRGLEARMDALKGSVQSLIQTVPGLSPKDGRLEEFNRAIYCLNHLHFHLSQSGPNAPMEFLMVDMDDFDNFGLFTKGAFLPETEYWQ